MLFKHRQNRGTDAAAFRKALFSIFGERELPPIRTSDSHDMITAWKASPQTRKAYDALFENMPGTEIKYIERVLEKTCNTNTPIHQKAFAIVTCENLLNPDLPDIIGKERIIKPLLPIFEEQLKNNDLHREDNLSTEGEVEDEEDYPFIIDDE